MRKVLVVSPHPDDESIGCGGTLQKHLSEGDRVQIIFLTSGEMGAKNISPQKLMRIREREAARVAKRSGFHAIEFWREPDGALKARPGLIRRLREKFITYCPEIVYVTHESEMHADHKTAAKIVRQVLKKKAGLKKIPEVFCFEVWTPIQKIDHIVDISKFIKKKIAAIRAYKSQCKLMRFDQAFLGLSRYRGEMHSWPGGDYAEVFTEMQI